MGEVASDAGLMDGRLAALDSGDGVEGFEAHLLLDAAQGIEITPFLNLGVRQVGRGAAIPQGELQLQTDRIGREVEGE